jgi:hypothetical protein
MAHWLILAIEKRLYLRKVIVREAYITLILCCFLLQVNFLHQAVMVCYLANCKSRFRNFRLYIWGLILL